MDRLVIDTSDSPEIIITKIHGTLRLKGWDRPQIRADMEHEDTIQTETSGNQVTISCTSGCLLRVPNDSTIQVGQVMNDLVIKSVDGGIKVKDVHGQVMVKSIGAFSVENAYGSLNARNVESDLVCGRIASQASIQDVDGKISLDQVLGNLSVRGYSSGIVANTNGQATLGIEPETDCEYSIKASGNISYRLEPFTSATINMKTASGKIRLNIPEFKETLTEKEHQLVVGEGDSQIFLESSGNIEIIQRKEKGRNYDYDHDYEYDFEGLEDLTTLADDITQMVTDQIETQMDSITQHINDLTSNLSSIDVRTSERARRTMEGQRRNLERKLAGIERKAAHKARIAERRIEQKMRSRGRTRKPASDPVSDEERQKVLEMLQNQQISVAQAEVLLAALEGQEPPAVQDEAEIITPEESNED